MPVTLTIEAATTADLHAEMFALMGRPNMSGRPDHCYTPDGKMLSPSETAKRMEASSGLGGSGAGQAAAPLADAAVPAPEQPTAEVVPIAERKKPGRPKKPATEIDAQSDNPAPAKNPEPTVEDARAVLKDIQTKIGNEEARQLNKKHGEEPLSEKKPTQWAAIIAEGKTLLAALDAE